MNAKKLFFDLLYIVLIVGVIWGMLSIVLVLKSEAKQCLENGFVYGAKEQMKGEVHCDCQELKDGKTYTFHFNETAWWSDRIKYDPMQSYLNSLNVTR